MVCTHNRRGMPLCQEFQTGNCHSTSGIFCPVHNGAVHQCSKCLAEKHGGNACNLTPREPSYGKGREKKGRRRGKRHDCISRPGGLTRVSPAEVTPRVTTESEDNSPKDVSESGAQHVGLDSTRTSPVAFVPPVHSKSRTRLLFLCLHPDVDVSEFVHTDKFSTKSARKVQRRLRRTSPRLRSEGTRFRRFMGGSSYRRSTRTRRALRPR